MSRLLQRALLSSGSEENPRKETELSTSGVKQCVDKRRQPSLLSLAAALCVSTFSSLHSLAVDIDSFAPWKVGAGAYSDDPRLPTLLKVATEARNKALARLRREWGLAPGPTPIHWKLDAAAPRYERSRDTIGPSRSPSSPDFELGRTFFDDGVVVVLLPARKFLARPGAMVPVIGHECVHAVHASHTGSPGRYEATPRWFREGAALFFSGEGQERVRERIAYTVYNDADASSFLTGIDAAEVTRAEAYLAVAWLGAQLGHERFAHLVRKIVSGKRGVGVVTELSGIQLATLRDATKRAARETIRGLLPERREERFRALIRRLRAADGSVTPGLEILLAEDEAGPLASTVRYLLAREALRSAEDSPRAVGAARGHLEALRGASGTLWRPEALVLLGQCYLREGRRAAARRSWREVREAFGEDRVVAEQARKLLAASGE